MVASKLYIHAEKKGLTSAARWTTLSDSAKSAVNTKIPRFWVVKECARPITYSVFAYLIHGSLMLYTKCFKI